MKDFLETLEIGESKVKLSSEDIKTILKKHGEYIKNETEKVKSEYQEQLDNNKSTIDELKNKIEKAPKSDELESLKQQIADFEQKEADRVAKQQAEDKNRAIEKNIVDVIGDKKFINDYTRSAVINEIKNALKDEANIGKSTKDLFEEITKDKEDIFFNPNKPADIPPVAGDVYSNIDKEAFNKMGYKERLALKQENPDLFKELNS